MAVRFFGIRADWAANYRSDTVGTALNDNVVSATVSAVRQGHGIKGDWKKRITEDFKGRKGK